MDDPPAIRRRRPFLTEFAGSVTVVVTDRFQHHAERVEPERRELGRRILRKNLWFVHYLSAELLHQAVDVVDSRA